MELGQLVDYVIEWNNVHYEETGGDGSAKQGKENETKRKATQSDWDAFFG